MRCWEGEHSNKTVKLPGARRGKGCKILQPAITAAGAARSALRAGCKDVALETVERYNLLKHCVSMLPPSSQSVHERPILARRHVEYFDPAVMSQVLSKVGAAKLVYSSLQTSLSAVLKQTGSVVEPAM